jgi:hypothetical protein
MMDSEGGSVKESLVPCLEEWVREAGHAKEGCVSYLSLLLEFPFQVLDISHTILIVDDVVGWDKESGVLLSARHGQLGPNGIVPASAVVVQSAGLWDWNQRILDEYNSFIWILQRSVRPATPSKGESEFLKKGLQWDAEYSGQRCHSR